MTDRAIARKCTRAHEPRARRARARYPAPVLQLPHYEILGRIGAGGMGEVWRARHRVLHREVAIKVIRPDALGQQPEQDRVLLGRFVREARAAAGLRSPHNVQATDFGTTEDGSFYLVMELLDGLDLQQLVARYGPQPPGRVAGLLRQAATALAEAHGQGLVHRDIKPSNLFLCRLGQQVEFLKVLDYGLVFTSAPSELTQSGVLPGSPAYLAPEIIRGAPATDRADTYALGAVAVWLLTGRHVFEGGNMLEQVAAHLERPAPRLRASLPDVPEALDALVASCLDKDPTRRPDARALGAALEGFSAWPAEAWWAEHVAAGSPPYRPPEGEPSPPVQPADRERAYAALKQHFEASRINMADFERRLGAARQAETPTRLEEAMQGLPNLEPTSLALPSASTRRDDIPAVPGAGRILSVLATVKHAGVWEPARAITATSVFGDVTIDLRHAELLPGCTTIHCRAIVGSITILVLPGTFVEVGGMGVLGSFEASPTGKRPQGDEPWVRVSGVSVLGSVDVKARPPDQDLLAGLVTRGATVTAANAAIAKRGEAR